MVQTFQATINIAIATMEEEEESDVLADLMSTTGESCCERFYRGRPVVLQVAKVLSTL